MYKPGTKPGTGDSAGARTPSPGKGGGKAPGPTNKWFRRFMTKDGCNDENCHYPHLSETTVKLILDKRKESAAAKAKAKAKSKG
eukprot:15011336-Heterocapsa_arctica.AAC.1